MPQTTTRDPSSTEERRCATASDTFGERWGKIGERRGKERGGKRERKRRGSKVKMNWKWMVSGLNERRRKKWWIRKEEKEEDAVFFFYFSFLFSL